MPYVLKDSSYDIYIGNISYRDDGKTVSSYCINCDEDNAHQFRSERAALKFANEQLSCRGEYVPVYIKPVPKNRPFTYKVLMEQADKMHRRIAVHSPLCAVADVRNFIASKVDECVDVERNKEALKVREWDEYKKKYAPMTKEEYDRRKSEIKSMYKKMLADLDTEWNTKGKNSPNFHKI